MSGLRPFWRYLGGKWRLAPRYPKPRHDTIIEPFAGAAGYSLRYPDRQVILVEKYAVIAAIWRWPIGADPAEIRAIPTVDALDDLPDWVPQSARLLIGMCFGVNATRPKPVISDLLRRRGRSSAEGWSLAMRERVASQVTAIRHWRVIEGEYSDAPNITATWFIDPPYRGKPGRRYVHTSSKLDHAKLSTWCRSRRGQAIVCESQLASWLPFVPFHNAHGAGGTSRESIWTHDDSEPAQLSLVLEAA